MKKIQPNKYSQLGAELIICDYKLQYIITEMYRVFRLSMEKSLAGKAQYKEVQHIFDTLVACDATISSDAPLAEMVAWVFGLVSPDRVEIAVGYLQDGLQENLTVAEFKKRIASVPGEYLHRKKALPLSLRYQERDPKFDKTVEDIKKRAFSKTKVK